MGEVRSAVSLVSVVITVMDVNDNSPMLVNSPPTSITLQEVHTLVHTHTHTHTYTQ